MHNLPTDAVTVRNMGEKKERKIRKSTLGTTLNILT